MGVFAIRVFAGGALAGHAPSEHTKKTLFFPLALYERDRQRAAVLADTLRSHGIDIKEAALRFAAWHGQVSSAIVGFGAAEHVDEAVAYLDAGPLPPEVLMLIDRA
jgi:aryl-alcohol dehydrogenase-like predicted oxidoreductase